MIKFTKLTTNHPGYLFVEELMHASFPKSERRDDILQRKNTDFNSKFSTYLITEDNNSTEEVSKTETYIGFITLWNLDGFTYAEHLATSPKVRNKGYGAKIIEALLNMVEGTIVLEVELPEDELSKRRIGFYKRCGFELCNKPYMQPPYRKDGESIPMHIMYTGKDNIDNEFNSIVKDIYLNVYEYNVEISEK